MSYFEQLRSIGTDEEKIAFCRRLVSDGLAIELMYKGNIQSYLFLDGGDPPAAYLDTFNKFTAYRNRAILAIEEGRGTDSDRSAIQEADEAMEQIRRVYPTVDREQAEHTARIEESREDYHRSQGR